MSFFNRLFRFRIFKFRTTLSEELEDLHTESNNLEQSLKQTRLTQQKWTKVFAIYAILAYLVLNIAYFTLFLSNDFTSRIYEFTMSLVWGTLLYAVHWILRWYFRTVIQMKEDRLALFKDRKQELIEEVKNKETYAVAKTLLEKYGESVTPQSRLLSTESGNRDLRQRVSVRPTPPGSNRPPVSGIPGNIGTLETFNPQDRTAPNATPGKLARDILPPQRTFWGAILDTIIGDGPSKRYALICKSCNSHNGMALEEEFEYISFRCAYCNYFNSASKRKPVFHDNAVAPESQVTTNENHPQNESTDEPMEASSSPDDDHTENFTHRSILIPAPDDANSHESHSASIENHPEHQLTSASSSE